MFSGWSALGLAASGRNPRDVRRPGGRSLSTYVSRSAGALSDVGAIERTMLVLEAAGLSSRDFRGRDLVAALTRRRRSNGSIGGFVSYTAFGVIALRAAGASAGGSTVSWLVSAQNADGGFGLAPASASDSDITGAALQALAVVGRARSAAARRAVAWLRANQNDDGGFGQFRGRSSNAQSTSYAVQGLVAAGAGGATLSRSLAYLGGLQRSDGSIAYSSSSSQTPVWVTAQALMALERAPLPLAAVPRRERKKREPAASAADVAAPPPAAAEPSAPSAGESSQTAGGEGEPAAPQEDEPAAVIPPLTFDRPSAEAPADDGLRVDRTDTGAAEGSSDGGPAIWLVALLVAAAALAAFLARRRLIPSRLRGRAST